MKRLLTKKFAIIFSIVIVLCAITATACFALMPKANLKPSDYDQGLTYEQAAKEGKPILALFYVDWCAYCKRFVPKYDKVRTLNKFNFSFVMINVEDPANSEIVNEYKISGYPTVYIIDPKYNYHSHIDYPFMETVGKLNKEVASYKNLRKIIDKADSCK